ncbi:type VI secretion system baseplate subunit TssK [Chitinophaga sp. sic0106]|uniref:type VI secretion system baseplate subunit TssK n=1 Tax=Chitinophaga sp. sic0106 TaxID=2854785 RepID=UPI001C45BE44|nr:type VI secretion system baseplate subunit TssK [Chitinophaga sp. sic0106]MBV7532253.1 type VI secretion system baseplate subunit TssK [Chitinophaga sp. sic0106]
MNTLVYYPLLNWQDGMKIHSQHFIDTENALISRTYQVFQSLTAGRRYGLLCERSNPPDFKIVLTPGTGDMYQLTVTACHAIMPGGAVIQVPAGIKEVQLRPVLECTCRLPAKGNQQYVLLQLRPFDRIPAGHTNTDTLPYKTYYVIEEALLSVATAYLPEENNASWWELPLGRLILQQGTWVMDYSYIPPCVRLGAHPLMLELANKTNAQLGYIYANCKVIIQKVYGRQQSHELAMAMLYIAEHLSAILLHHICWQTNGLQHIAPYEWYELLYKIAATWNGAIDQRAAHMKEELIQYFSEWVDMTPGEIEQIMATAVLTAYHHQDMMTALRPLHTFVELVHKLTHAISQLEFMGRRPDANIFVKEERVANPVYEKQTKKAKWSFSE